MSLFGTLDKTENSFEELYLRPEEMLKIARKRLKPKQTSSTGFSLFKIEINAEFYPRKITLMEYQKLWKGITPKDKKNWQKRAQAEQNLYFALNSESKYTRSQKILRTRPAFAFYYSHETHKNSMKSCWQQWKTEDPEVIDLYNEMEAADRTRHSFEKEVLSRFDFVIRLMTLTKSPLLRSFRSTYEFFHAKFLVTLPNIKVYSKRKATELSQKEFNELNFDTKTSFTAQMQAENQVLQTRLLNYVLVKTGTASCYGREDLEL